MPPSPPAEKATACQDQAGKSCKPRLWSPAGWSADRRGPRRFRNGRRVGSRRPEKEGPAEAGQGTSWKENQGEAYQHQQRIAAVLRLVAQQPLPGVGPDAAIGSVSEMSQQSNFKNRAVVVKVGSVTVRIVTGDPP